MALGETQTATRKMLMERLCEQDLPEDVKFPTALLARRLQVFVEDNEPMPLVNGYADFEPERYTIEAPSIASTLDRLDPEQDSTYCGLMAAALTTPNLDETAKQGIAQLRATHRAMVVSA